VLSEPHEPASPDEWDKLDDTNHSSTRLIILRGYPSARWMQHLGARYRVDPEFWSQHADFLNDTVFNTSDSRVLPSSCTATVQVPLYTIGSHRIPQGRSNQQAIDKARRESRESMIQYRHMLSMGTNWLPCASMVRDHWVLGEEDFCIEQRVSVTLMRREHIENSWTSTVNQYAYFWYYTY